MNRSAITPVRLLGSALMTAALAGCNTVMRGTEQPDSQDESAGTQRSNGSSRRGALVIGNESVTSGTLPRLALRQ